ncbi:hypothetical protein ZTR_10320 [Talaromyces verruculosus]|nr:hypothetical protein ZTR_10320 [Talaromyces verruculosus]
MRRGNEFTEKVTRDSITRPAPQLAEPFSEETVAEDPAFGQSSVTDRPADQPASPSNIELTEIEEFAYRFDHAALESNSKRWSNIPELIDLSKVEVERIPQALFAPETMRQPKYIEDMVDSCPKDCRIVLAIFRCGNYAFFTAQCFDHFVTTRESNAKPVGMCNPQTMKERHFVPYLCLQDRCPVCYDQEDPESVLEVLRRRRLPN